MSKKKNKKYYNGYVKDVQTVDEWDTGIKYKTVKDCGYFSKQGKPIHISEDVVKVIKTLCAKIEVEWQALLIGSELKDKVKVTGYYIPKQKVSGATVENLEPINLELIEKLGVVAGIHSHANMGVFFSGTDEEMNMGDIRFNIVVNNKNEVKAVEKIMLPCGGIYFADCSVVTSEEECVEVEGIDNIEKGYANYGHGFYGYGSYYDDEYDLFSQYGYKPNRKRSRDSIKLDGME